MFQNTSFHTAIPSQFLVSRNSNLCDFCIDYISWQRQPYDRHAPTEAVIQQERNRRLLTPQLSLYIVTPCRIVICYRPLQINYVISNHLKGDQSKIRGLQNKYCLSIGCFCYQHLITTTKSCQVKKFCSHSKHSSMSILHNLVRLKLKALKSPLTCGGKKKKDFLKIVTYNQEIATMPSDRIPWNILQILYTNHGNYFDFILGSETSLFHSFTLSTNINDHLLWVRSCEALGI